MGLILKIAWRNILRHKGKSLVVGLILFIGSFLMTLGNGVITGMDKGIQANIINSFMGHLVLVSEKQKSDNVFFDLYGKAVAPINNFSQIKPFLQKHNAVSQFLPVGKNMAMALNEESDMVGVYLLGVDFKEYQKMFPGNIRVIEGRLLNDRERGVLFPTFTRKQHYNLTNFWFIPEGGEIVEANLTPEAKENRNDLLTKNTAVFLGSNDDNSTTDVRVGIKGIIQFKALNTFWGHFLILDIESYRECLGYFAASNSGREISKERQDLLSMDNENLDNIFGDNETVVADQEKTVEDVVFTRETQLSSHVNLENGTYNLILIKVKDPSKLDRLAESLEKDLKAEGFGLRVLTWKKASGMIGSLSVLIKGFLFGFVAFLFLVAVIIIMNTLSMAALERITEIGMMRAVGAQKSFISGMFVGETAILSSIFGGLGIIAGIITVFALPYFHITTDNDMVQILYGGDVLAPILDFKDIIVTIAQLVFVTLLSVIFPVNIAKNITPLDAISRE
ncbi:MAG: FtsX-like permease family protein [Candidatus Omnitrophica bacterium]|nr:FtsX-like permease family protein [Candidatus Omnitrophota bacterium]